MEDSPSSNVLDNVTGSRDKFSRRSNILLKKILSSIKLYAARVLEDLKETKFFIVYRGSGWVICPIIYTAVSVTKNPS